MRRPLILIAAGDPGLHLTIEALLTDLQCDIQDAFDDATVLPSQLCPRPDLVILGAPDGVRGTILDMAREIRRIDRSLPVIMVTDRSTEEFAVAAFRAGISDYLRLPLEGGELVSSVERCLGDYLDAGIPAVGHPGPALVGTARMIGTSRAIRLVRARVAQVAGTESTVLITGETGTGKELVAELIQGAGARANRALVRINCAAIPDTLLESELFGYERGAFTGAVHAQPGKLELAQGGTVFFDEIGDMSLLAQAKILRVIEARETYRLGGKKCVPLDIRLIAATNQDLEPMVMAGRFRKDLYFRLNVVRIHLPPLRELRQDIRALIDHCIEDLNRRLGVGIKGVTGDARDALITYDWPGNVRELKNILEAAAAAAPFRQISLLDRPRHLRGPARSRESVTGTAPDTDERKLLLSALSTENWNKSKAAARLRWSRMTLYRKLKKYRLSGKATPAGVPDPGD